MCKRKGTRPRLYITGAVICTAIIFILYNEQYSVKNSFTCYYSETGDALPSAEDPRFFPKAKSIFFHETSCRGGLTVRQACAVEAAARSHSDREIYVLFSAPVTDYGLKSGCLAELLKFPNVKFLRVHAAEYSNGTAVQSMLLNDAIAKHSRFRIQHTADILRILTLNKWGGIYLDTDMIVTKSLEDLPPNFIAYEDHHVVSTAIMAFAKDEIGTNLTNAIIREISKAYDPSSWSFVGRRPIEYVLQALCPRVVRSLAIRTKPITDCKGVTIFNYELFYPQGWWDVPELFNPPMFDFDLNRPYTYHMYNFLSLNKTISRGTVYETIAKAFCPTIHSTYPDEFSAEASN